VRGLALHGAPESRQDRRVDSGEKKAIPDWWLSPYQLRLLIVTENANSVDLLIPVRYVTRFAVERMVTVNETAWEGNTAETKTA
jgi:hypothetical protein